MAADSDVLIPIRQVGCKFDNDDPAYVFSPALYLGLPPANDSLGAPTPRRDAGGIWQPDFTAMQPRLALRWEEQPDGDWIVWLRPGVRSNHGHEFEAADLVWVMEKSFAHASLGSWRWRDVVGVERMEILDRHTLRYHLRRPYPTFPNWLLSLAPNVVDSKAIRAQLSPDDPWGITWLNSHVAGFGAYDLGHADADSVVFKRRADYWMGEPDAARIEARRWPDRPGALRLLDEARPVVIVGADPDETAALLGRDDLRTERTW